MFSLVVVFVSINQDVEQIVIIININVSVVVMILAVIHIKRDT